MNHTDTPAPVILSALILAALALSFCLSGLAYGADSGTLEVLRSMPVHRTDRGERPAERADRLRGIAEAIDQVSQTEDEAALLLTVGRHESGFAAAVGSGERTGDDGKAWGYWQSWDPGARGPVERQARHAIEHLRRAGAYCATRGHNRVRGALSLYATGHSCDWDGAADRVVTYRAVRGRL